jgi:hypothetical protein
MSFLRLKLDEFVELGFSVRWHKVPEGQRMFDVLGVSSTHGLWLTVTFQPLIFPILVHNRDLPFLSSQMHKWNHRVGSTWVGR